MTKQPGTGKRVVVTGLSCITPLGIGLEASWENLIAGRSGIAEITRFDASEHGTKIAGEVKGFDPSDHLPKKEAKRTQPFLAYAVATSRMALENAGLAITDENAPEIGVYLGCGLGGLEMLEQSYSVLINKGPSRVSPFFIPLMIGNMAAGIVSMFTGAKGPNVSVATACAAGSHGIGEAFLLIKNGYAQAMIAGGVESVITATCFAGFNALKALSTRNSDPQKASRPFEKDRDGFVVGEGCGILILESLEHAKQRGATIYAEVTGYGLTGDAHHMTAPAPDGEGMSRCMKMALADAGIKPGDVDYINAHGTSTQLNDFYETQAIINVFGEHATGKKLAVSSTKSMTGHLLGGAGGVEGVFSVMALNNNIMPATINYETPDPDLALDYIPNAARERELTYVMSNSFGFGGTNACLVFKKYNE